MSLSIVPSASHKTTTDNLQNKYPSAPSAPGVPDRFRANLTSTKGTENAVQSTHPLEARVRQWRATQQALKQQSLRRTFGMSEPIRRGMELHIVRAGEWRPACVGGSSHVHEDVLTGRETDIDWEDVYTDAAVVEGRERISVLDEIEAKVHMAPVV